MPGVANGLTLLLGGARSGKSELAVDIGKRYHADVTFIATAEPLDADMTRRIEQHRCDRPPWAIIEAPLALERALGSSPSDDLVIVDCLTLWVSNMLHAGHTDDSIEADARACAALAATRPSPTVAVSNEVGLGIHPDTDLGRRYRDLLGRVNRHWAGAAHRSLFLAAGRAVVLDDPWKVLE